MRKFLILAVTTISTLANAEFAAAQSNNLTLDCALLEGVNEPSGYDIAACSKSRTNLQALINNSGAVNANVNNRLAPDVIVPSGLSYLTEAAAADYLKSNGAVTIIPSADVAVAAPAPNWNIWKDVKYSWISDGVAFSELEGSLINFVGGADYKISDSVVIGLMGSYETSDREGAGPIPPTITTEGYGVGAYMGANLSSSVVFSANVLQSWIDTDVNSGVLESESSRTQAAAALTGYYYSGTTRFSPSINLAWSREVMEDKAGFTPDVTFESAVLSPGFQVGNTIALSDTVTVEPWLGGQVDWAFINTTELDGFGTILDDPYVDLRLQAGLNFSLGTRAQLALIAEASGLLLDTTDTYTVGANFAFQF